ncbi:hypothetical protein ACOME3_000888 [Neoechinorhynchus agilis]
MSVSGSMIQLQIGGCGNRLGSHYWLALSDEHNINTSTGRYEGSCLNDLLFAETSFNLNKQGQYRPKCILIDNDKSRVDGIIAEAGLQSFMCDNSIVVVKGDSMCVDRDWVETKISVEPIFDELRKELEINDYPCGLQLVHSASGAFTSRCTSELLLEIKNRFSKKFVMNAVVLPDIEPGSVGGGSFRMIPLFDSLINHSNGCILYDNRSLQSIWHSLHCESIEMCSLNRLAAAHLSGMTATYRLPGPMNRTISSLMSGITIFPEMHFYAPSIAPMYSLSKNACCKGNVFDFTRRLFDIDNLMIEVTKHPNLIKYYASSCVYRGVVSPFEARREIDNLISKRPETFPPDSGFIFEHAFVSIHNEHGPLALSAITSTNGCADPLQRIIDTCTVKEGKVLERFLENKGEDEKTEFHNQEKNLMRLVEMYDKDALDAFDVKLEGGDQTEPKEVGTRSHSKTKSKKGRKSERSEIKAEPRTPKGSRRSKAEPLTGNVLLNHDTNYNEREQMERNAIEPEQNAKMSTRNKMEQSESKDDKKKSLDNLESRGGGEESNTFKESHEVEGTLDTQSGADLKKSQENLERSLETQRKRDAGD